MLANISGRKLRLGNKKYIKELFEINKFRLKHNLAAYDNGKINKDLCKQIVFNALLLNEIQWTEKFIEKYTPLLFEEYQESMKNLAKACIYFNTKKYNDVLVSLNKFEFKDITDKITVKNLIARTYYEMKEFELLVYHLDSTKHFLKNNKNLSSYLSEVNSIFFNYLYSIVTAVENNDSKKIIKLEESIRNGSAFNDKIWLLEKIAEKILQ